MLLLAGVTAAAFIAGSGVSLAQMHEHCTTTGCKENGCTANHPGFECKVTDDDVCNCVDPPPIEG
jgi:hypothetical protein